MTGDSVVNDTDIPMSANPLPDLLMKGWAQLNWLMMQTGLVFMLLLLVEGLYKSLEVVAASSCCTISELNEA